MNAKVNPLEMFQLNVDSRCVGLFSREQLWKMRSAIDMVLATEGVEYDCNKVVETVCSAFKLRREELFSKRRPTRIAFPRQVAMALIYEGTPLSLNEVGQLFGGRDHGTVLHAIKVVNGRRHTNIEGRVIQAIESTLAALHKPKDESMAPPSCRTSTGNAGNGSGMALRGSPSGV